METESVATAFALVREAAVQTIGQRHYDVQLVGGWILLEGMVAEMETGEGKTLTATLAAAAAALAGVPVHVITVNDYLAERDAKWMAPIYEALGLDVGTIVHGMTPDRRQKSYACAVAYCTNKELAFDYLRDRITLRGDPSRLHLQLETVGTRAQNRNSRLLLRGLHFGIVDEADSVLVDEARTPLIISGAQNTSNETEMYEQALDMARHLTQGRHYRLLRSERRVEFTASGRGKLQEFGRARGKFWVRRQLRDELVMQGLTALHLFQRDEHYLVRDEKVQIIDEYTGRLMPDRSWEDGLHQMIEVKEGCPITAQNRTLARISYQRFFRRYIRLAGMTGTAKEVSRELERIYGLTVVRVPTNRPLRRVELRDRVVRTRDEKWDTVVERIRTYHELGRPVLVGTRSVEASETLSSLLNVAGLEHQVLNARQDEEEADTIARAGEAGRITVATNMAGRGTDIRLGDGVAEGGGLHVIATERHDARRIDRQLSGRCGRQGDPGTFEVVVSLEDEILETHANRLRKTVAGRNGLISAAFLTRSLFRHAQKKAERKHARIRADLLRMDEFLDNTLAFSGVPE
jgi:preprotein translocase subunit SecA